ncbi:MAG: 1-acyl-sn-glycerol-3-phosphate acyltransferase [Candidatus Sericytochromatia bacterium]
MEEGHPFPRDLERNPERLEKRLFVPLRVLIGLGYFRLEVTGLEHVPADGPLVFVANHAGWMALDALMLSLVMHDRLGRQPHIAVHELLLKLPVYPLIKDLGLFPAQWLSDPEELPAQIRDLLVFPEGEEGNFKPFWQAYRMQGWHCGFVRAALEREARVVPVAVVGGEESTPALGSLGILKPWLGIALPLPIPLPPLPTRWKISFLPPLDVSAFAEHRHLESDNLGDCHFLARQLRPQVQAVLDKETAGRPLARLSRLLG